MFRPHFTILSRIQGVASFKCLFGSFRKFRNFHLIKEDRTVLSECFPASVWIGAFCILSLLKFTLHLCSSLCGQVSCKEHLKGLYLSTKTQVLLFWNQEIEAQHCTFPICLLCAFHFIFTCSTDAFVYAAVGQIKGCWIVASSSFRSHVICLLSAPGVLAQENLPGDQFARGSSYIAASYVKYLEGAGSRVMPIRYRSQVLDQRNQLLYVGPFGSVLTLSNWPYYLSWLFLMNTLCFSLLFHNINPSSVDSELFF